MSEVLSHPHIPSTAPTWRPASEATRSDAIELIKTDPQYQAYTILHVGYVIAPLVAGFDKFTHYLVNWDQYLAPVVPRVTGIDPNTFMKGVGVIEIVAALGVAFKPRIFAYVVSAWLIGIVVNLLLTGNYYDIALRDFGLALGALALARLSLRYDRPV